MGRGGRKSPEAAESDGLEPGGTRTHWTDTHPDRDMWSPGRLAIARTQTREEYEALYGRGPRAEAVIESRFFPDISREDMQRLQTGFFTGSEAREFIAGMRMPERFGLDHLVMKDLQQDPILLAFWQSEVRRLEQEADFWEREGLARHWFRDFSESEDLGALQRVWVDRVVRSWLWNPEEERLGGWSTDEAGQKKIQGMPHSIMSAALEQASLPLDQEKLAEQLQQMQEINPEAAARLFEDQLLSEIDYLTLRRPDRYRFADRPREVLLRELWAMSARHLTADGILSPEVLDVEDNKNRFALFIPEPEREVFLRTPLLLDRSRAGADGWQRQNLGIFEEAWARKGPWRYDLKTERSLNLNDSMNAANSILEDHVIRVYSGLQGTQIALLPDRARLLREQQENAVENSQGVLRKMTGSSIKGPLPLDNLRPLFEKESKEEMFEELQNKLRQLLADGQSFDVEDVLRDAGTKIHGRTIRIEALRSEDASLCDKIFAQLGHYLYSKV